MPYQDNDATSRGPLGRKHAPKRQQPPGPPPPGLPARKSARVLTRRGHGEDDNGLPVMEMSQQVGVGMHTWSPWPTATTDACPACCEEHELIAHLVAHQASAGEPFDTAFQALAHAFHMADCRWTMTWEAAGGQRS